MLVSLWASFFISLGFIIASTKFHASTAGTPPVVAASLGYGPSESDLIGVANYQPFTDAAKTSIFQFTAAVTLLPPNIISAGSDGSKNATALQWGGSTFPANKHFRGDTWEFTAEYTDSNGILLSGEDIRLEVLASVCWKGCTSQSSWHAVFTEDAPAFIRKVQVRDRNDAGVPTTIRWDIIAFKEYTPSQQYASIAVRYLNGQFGSCGGDADDDDGAGSRSCMRLTKEALIDEDYSHKNLALASAVVVCLCTISWVIVVHRSSPKGWNSWMSQQKWTLVMAVGVIVFQNPVETIYLYFDNLDNQPQLSRAFEAVTSAGLAIVLLVASFWADSARHRVQGPLAFYGPKVAYMATLWVFFFLGLLAIYPLGQSDASFWAVSVWCWPAGRTMLLVVAVSCFLVLAVLGGFFYYYFLHCSFQVYRKVPYMLIRAEQLSFRFVVSTFSFFVFMVVLTAASRFFIAIFVAIDDGDKEASTTARAGAFFKFLFGQSVRSSFTMLYLAISVIIFEVAFLPATAMHLLKYKPQYVRLESDLASDASQPSTSSTTYGTAAKGAAAAGVAATAAVAAAAATATATATAAGTVASAVTGGAAPGVVSVSALSPERPVFVIERARWLAAISAEAYECFSAEEQAQRGRERMAEVAQLGCEVVAMIQEAPDMNLHDTHCLVVRHKATRRLIVAFRGTVSKKQMKTDIQGWHCQLNLDLFAETRKDATANPFVCCSKRVRSSPPQPGEASSTREDEELGGAAVLAGSEERELPPPQLPRPQLSQAAASPSSKSGRSRSTVRTKTAKHAKHAHMVTEDNLPDFLLELGKGLQLPGPDAAVPLEPKAAEAAAAATHAQAAATHAQGEEKKGYQNDVLDAYGEENPYLGEADEGRQPSSTAAKAYSKHRSVGGSAAAAAAAGSAAAQALRERVAAVHAKRVAAASRRARAARGRVHFGFWSSYSTVRERVLAVVHEELLREPGQLFVTGHSLGGALATLAAYDLSLWLLPVVNARLGRGSGLQHGPVGSSLAEHEEEIRLTMYNFGSPRVGDFFFAQRYNTVVPHTYRIVCDGDVITGMPPKRFGYIHVGCAAIVDRTGSGSLLIDPSFLEARFKTSRALKVAAHLLGPYMAAIDGCLYPLETTEEVLALIDTVYQGHGGGEWCGCPCYWLCCDGRLPGWLGCGDAGCRPGPTSATGAVGDAEGKVDAGKDG